MTKSKGTKYNYMEPSVRYDVFLKKVKCSLVRDLIEEVCNFGREHVRAFWAALGNSTELAGWRKEGRGTF